MITDKDRCKWCYADERCVRPEGHPGEHSYALRGWQAANKISIAGGVIDVVYIASSRDVVLAVDLGFRADLGTSIRARLVMDTVQARQLKLELERVLREDA